MKKRTRTLKEIAIELLEKYEASETACIYEYSGDFNSATKELDKEIAEYRKEIEQTDCNANQCVQRVEYIGDIEKKHCRTCKHFESEFHTPISSDGTYYPYVICTAKECHYESVDTPQTDCGWK